jgi:hypothetical protein
MVDHSLLLLLLLPSQCSSAQFCCSPPAGMLT